jgi:hypothetical protein
LLQLLRFLHIAIGDKVHNLGHRRRLQLSGCPLFLSVRFLGHFTLLPLAEEDILDGEAGKGTFYR